MAFLIYSGLTNDPHTKTTGIWNWCCYDNSLASNPYFTDNTVLTIDTPNFPTLSNGLTVNGANCGVGMTDPSQIAVGQNVQGKGPCGQFGALVGQAWPATTPTFYLGGVNWTDYTNSGKDKDDFAADMGTGMWVYGNTAGLPQPQHIYPGQLDQENINVILPSSYVVGGKGNAPDNDASRIHYEVSRGGNFLAILLAKIWAGTATADIGKIGNTIGINASMSNEEAAANWLANGYGLEDLGSPLFALEI